MNINLAELLDREYFLKAGIVPFADVKAKRKTRRKKAETLTDLLSDLDAAYKTISDIPKSETTALSIMRKLGVHVTWLESEAEVDGSSLEFFDFEGTPTAMAECLFPSDTGRGGDDPCRYVMYAEKVDFMPGVEMTKGETMYQFGATHILDRDKNGGLLEEPVVVSTGYHVGVSKSGKVRALRRFHKGYNVARAKVRNGYGGAVYIPDSRWIYPPAFAYGKDVPANQRKETIETQFKLLYNLHVRRSMGATIFAEKDGIRMCFTVPEGEWKDFFSSRIPVVVDGIKKKIFHWVSAHTRVRRGKSINIGTHTRGVREFHWNGFNVKISLSGKHGRGVHTFNATNLFHDKTEPREGFVDVTDDMLERVHSLAT